MGLRRSKAVAFARGGVFAVALLLTGGLLASPVPPLGEAELAAYHSLSLDELFMAVATGIRYEPYAGVLRGPRGTALARGGNAADQALLLAELLRRQGYRVRFVTGHLAGENLKTLLRGLYPPVLPKISALPQFSPYTPAGDSRLPAVAADHVWVEVGQPGGEWLPLDPAFPRAKVGEAYAESQQRHEQLPEIFYQRLRVSVHEQLVNGDTREVGHAEGRVAELALQPLSLLVVSAPQYKTPEQKPKRTPTDMFGGALSGQQPDKKKAESAAAPPPTIGTRYRRALSAAGQQQPITDALALDAEPDKHLSREWLRFELTRPGGAARVLERELFVKGGPGDSAGRPADYRRYSIAVAAGPLQPEAIARHARALGQAIDLAGIQRQLATLAKASANADTAQQLSRLEESASLVSGHMAALTLSAEISELTRRIAFSNGVSYAQAVPAITIISLEGAGADRYEVGADLRLDEVEAWPYPGAPIRSAEHFQGARGIQGTMLEGIYVQRLAGKNSGANALSLLSATGQGPGGWLVYAPGEQAQLAQVAGLTPVVRQRLETALAAGREVIINARPVELAGRLRHGWWERDRATGRVIGVMDDGRHGAMTEYSLKGEKLGLSDDTGMIIGLIVGAAGTQTLLAAKVLEEGTVTEEAIKEIEEMIKRLECLSCPKAEAKVEAEEKNTLSCWEVDKVTKFSQGESAKAEIQFCEKYVKGLKCASSMVLGGYKQEPTLGGWTYEAKAEVKIGCEELFSRGGKSEPKDR